MEKATLARDKKKACAQGRTILFLDESGLSQRPHRVRTWAPRGKTPVLEFAFNWKSLSAIAGLTWWNYYFALHSGSIKSPQVIEFLRHLLRHLPGKLLILWDGAPIHRSKLVSEFIAAQGQRLRVEFIPAYAPELNPVEYLWGYFKQRSNAFGRSTNRLIVTLASTVTILTSGFITAYHDRIVFFFKASLFPSFATPL